MSVHGEYGRALEGVIDAVGASRHPDAPAWRGGLEGARLAARPDLSDAARASLAILEAIAASADVPERLSDRAEHLDRHCRVILGLPAT